MSVDLLLKDSVRRSILTVLHQHIDSSHFLVAGRELLPIALHDKFRNIRLALRIFDLVWRNLGIMPLISTHSVRGIQKEQFEVFA